MIDARLWGKSDGLAKPYPVIGHLVDSAMVCGAVWDGVLTAAQRLSVAEALGVELQQARRVVMFWAGLHDLGKIMPQFQDLAVRERPAHCGFLREAAYTHDRVNDSRVKKVRHEYATHRALPQLLAQFGYPVSGGRIAKLLLAQVAQILGGHHGRYSEGIEPQDLRDPLIGLPELGAGAWTEQRREHVAALYEVLERPAVPVCSALPTHVAVVIAGVVIVSDWIASQEHVIHQQQKSADAHPDFGSSTALRAHARSAERMAPALVEDAGLGRATFGGGAFRDLFPEITSPYPLQLSVEAGLTGAVNGPGILLVTAPTGDGKTETALYAASLMGAACGTSGLFFALPTQATANQMYGRLVRFAEKNLLESAQLTLLHGAADLYAPYTESADELAHGGVDPRLLSDHETSGDQERQISVEASRWLRKQGRGILAPLAVGTIDQALMGVLPLKRNALRHLGLSGKTVVIDEAHAYDAYTHALLLRLLEWLGAMGVPVVLLSATLTGETARGMVRAYLSGADADAGAREIPVPSYPGWLFASVHSDHVIEPAELLRSERERELEVDVRHVTHTYEPTVEGGRLATLLGVLDDVATGGGCVALICTTVAEAQQTYDALRAHYRSRYGDDYAGWDDRSEEDQGRKDSDAGPRLRLLHARFPARRRAEITAEAEKWFGRTDKPEVRRPSGTRGAVLVATQVIEQSLDLDFDLVVSDLAPMAMLLQRAGRVWRHADPAPTRPDWSGGPRLVVLAPVGKDRGLSVPASWGDVYAHSLLRRTVELLERRNGASLAVPGDVQKLVDAVYDHEFASAAPEKLMEQDLRRMADDMARRALAGMVALPAPRMVTSLHTLTTSDADEELVRTRLGAEAVQVLPVFENEAGRWLDEECSIRLPESGHGSKGRFTTAEVRALLGYVAPLAHGPWRAECGPANVPPAAWRDEPRLARLVLLPHRVTGAGRGAVLGETRITCDRELGLIIHRDGR
ncbi:CRISPR-associated endonuclease Cas3'' [Streptomyces lushanensis]|uniref:CRISPR-associated endonuclease Cas3'' n=1 Tax=Streptomyces lushanensis TaxID=1434255 RepID=UPI00082AEFFB|nr:CRISPR-associated endonuclease Cas3'' [Streptomyces lushanensis]